MGLIGDTARLTMLSTQILGGVMVATLAGAGFYFGTAQ